MFNLENPQKRQIKTQNAFFLATYNLGIAKTQCTPVETAPLTRELRGYFFAVVMPLSRKQNRRNPNRNTMAPLFCGHFQHRNFDFKFEIALTKIADRSIFGLINWKLIVTIAKCMDCACWITWTANTGSVFLCVQFFFLSVKS